MKFEINHICACGKKHTDNITLELSESCVVDKPFIEDIYYLETTKNCECGKEIGFSVSYYLVYDDVGKPLNEYVDYVECENTVVLSILQMKKYNWVSEKIERINNKIIK